MNSNLKPKLSFRKKLAIVGFALYIIFILLSIVPYIAESHLQGTRAMDASYTYNLVFPKDGEQSHYIVERADKVENGEIDLTYTTASHTLDVNAKNIKKLTIDCKSIYDDESQDVFKQNPSASPNYYMDYFKNHNLHFTVIVTTDNQIELRFRDMPEPVEVWVKEGTEEKEWWKSNTNYRKEGLDIVVEHVPKGNTEVKLYFKARPLPKAEFKFGDENTFAKDGKTHGYVNKLITFDAGTSNDNVDGGSIVEYSWDFGDDGTSTENSPTTSHKYTKTGAYTVTLTVKDNIGQEGTTTLPITIVESEKKEEEEDQGMFGLGKIAGVDTFIFLILLIIIIVLIIVAAIMRKPSEVEEEEEEEEEEVAEEAAEVKYECPECGAVMDQSATQCPECGTEFETEEFECPDCGANLPSDATSCPECGVEFETEEDEEVEETPEEPTEVEEPVEEEVEEEPVEEEEEEGEEEPEEYECPDCGASVPSDATICPECGAEFE